jgi:hypothetical protein
MFCSNCNNNIFQMQLFEAAFYRIKQISTKSTVCIRCFKKEKIKIEALISKSSFLNIKNPRVLLFILLSKKLSILISFNIIAENYILLYRLYSCAVNYIVFVPIFWLTVLISGFRSQVEVLMGSDLEI